MSKRAGEVCEVMLDIFCEQGPPHILHSDNGGEFNNQLLFSTLAEKWPTTRGAGWIMDYGFPGFEIHQIHYPWI